MNPTRGMVKVLVMVVISSLLLFVAGCGSNTAAPAKEVKKGEFLIKMVRNL